MSRENEELKSTLADREERIKRLTNLICVSTKIHDNSNEEKVGKAARDSYCFTEPE